MWIATWSELKVSKGTSSSDDAASYPLEFLTVPVAFELVIFIILFPYCHVSPWEWSALRIFQVLHKRAKEHSQQNIFTQEKKNKPDFGYKGPVYGLRLTGLTDFRCVFGS
jgi:hypothetical protein